MAAPSSNDPISSCPPNLVDEFEIAFQNCFANLNSQESSSSADSDELKTGAEQSIQKFLDVAKQLEAFFLQKRLILSVMKPEQIVKEDVNEMGTEIGRKDNLLQKHYVKLQHWQNMLRTLPGSQPPQQGGAQSSQQQQPPPPMNQQQNLQQIPHSQTQHMVSHGMPHHTNSAMSMSMGLHQSHMPPPQIPGAAQSMQFQQGPLAHLERTTSNIGMPDGSR
ncbi:mediator of RNA polymerase II transcription subunit 28-like [Tubulanus polymorphus]|uniref:mediator of RNA polymerase II transcription subunit 28-like n=1 Tax=Tubulanus polymorphus TaxID=672921 RepID=UPI003DA577C4